MSIRKYNKDHLKKHAVVMLAAPVRVDAPGSDDPLVFWTQHDKHPCEVNLHSFATGQRKSHVIAGGKKFIPFTGRPELISQLAPAIEEALSYVAIGTVEGYMAALRQWWRILDAVEAAAAAAGQPMKRVEDVRLLTHVHSEFAYRNGIIRQTFGKFRTLVDTVRMALGARQTYWESPERPDVQKHIPPLEQRNALRFAVRRICRSTLETLEQSDGLNGTIELPFRKSAYPNHWDADAVWHLCVLNTGWNPSTLTTLDATKTLLTNHFKDDPADPHRRFVLSPQTYELIGEKQRAGGKEQFVTGQWKTQDGPGHLIKTYLARVEPLRELLKQQLAQERLRYEQMGNADYQALRTQFAQIKTLERGVRSVWLYLDRNGKISWIHDKSTRSGNVNGKQVAFLDEVVHMLNTQRATTNLRRAENREDLTSPLAPIPHVAAKNFRLWFADYVYRASHGNMLQVKKALNHSRLSTSTGYTNTNILNQEASDAARRFLNIFVGELNTGRVDLTILAHLYRHGMVTPEQEELLAQARTLPKSRMNVGCKDARNPPPHIKATPDQDCDVQRCLLCLENAVLLPESIGGIAMRVEELRALQGSLPIETWVEERYDIELKNNLMALRKFNLNQGLAARKKWAQTIASGDHYVPGLPLASSPDQMELV